MIRILRQENKINQLIVQHRQVLNAPYNILRNLEDAIQNSTHSPQKRTLLRSLQENIEVILFGLPEQLNEILSQIEQYYNLALLENPSTLKAELNSIFDYDKFVANYNGYGAYALTKSINLKVCPYCNRISIIVSDTEDGRTRASLDHWLCRDLYPYLSLSLFNLIPSCKPCNSDFKRAQKFSFNDHIHPYVEGYEIDYNFAIHTDKAEITEEDDFSIMLRAKTGGDPALIGKAIKTAGVFNINHVYNQEKHIALDLIRDRAPFSDAYINDMLAKGAFSDREHYIRCRLQLKFSVEEYGKETYSKFKRDLATDLGMAFPE